MLLKRNPRTLAFSRTLRRRQTSTELMLWKKLRARKFHGYKFRRQSALGTWIPNFICLEKKLVIEIDGMNHIMRKKKDAIRDAAMVADGYRILRFNNTQVRESMDWVLAEILQAIEPHQKP